MSENATPEADVAVGALEGNNSDQTRVEQTVHNANATRHPRNDFRQSNSSRNFQGATPKIGGVLGLRSENVTEKVAFDVFCEKVSIYVMTEFKNGENVVEVLKDHDTKVIDDFQKGNKPEELTEEEKKSTIDVEIKKEEIKEYVKDLELIKSNLKKLYTVIFGNCTDGVKTMLKADAEYAEKLKTFNQSWILEKGKMIVQGLDTKVNKHVTMHTAIYNFMLMKQYDAESNDAYLTRFKSMVQTLKIAGGGHMLVSKTMLGKEIHEAIEAEIDIECEKFMGMCFILRSHKGTYKKLLDDLKRSSNLGRDKYPETLTEAFNLLVIESGEYDSVRQTSNHRYGRGRSGRGGRGRSSFLFAQQGRGNERDVTYTRINDNNSDEIIAGTDGEVHPTVPCFGCKFLGHYRNACPHVARNGTVSLHVRCTLANKDTFDISDSWLLLDTCSTCDVIKNPDFITDMKECKPHEQLIAYCNGGEQRYNLVAKLQIFPISVHFKRNSMANIISMKTVTDIEGTRATMDTNNSANIVVTLSGGEDFVFKPCRNGLYYFDTSEVKSSDKSKNELINYSLLQTVEENKITSLYRKSKERTHQGIYNNTYITRAHPS